METGTKRHYLLVTLYLAILLALISACAPAPKAAEPAKPAAGTEAKVPASTAQPAAVSAPAGKKDLIVIQGSDVSKLDPHMSTTDPDIKVSFNIFDNLLDRDQSLKLIPALATEWKSLDDLTWQFKLRQGVKFQNGDPFNAKDVKFSLDRTGPNGDPKAVTRAAFTSLDRVDIVDDYTVNVVTKFPDALMPDRLAFYGGQIIPKSYFDKVGADEFNAKPVGTGPLKFVEWVKDDHLTLEANKEWWGGKLGVERVIVKPMPESASRVAALLKGEADIITQLPPDDVDRVNKSANAAALGVPYAGLYTIATVYNKPFPLNNNYFHQAMSLAIDRQSIQKDLFRGRGVVPSGIYPQGDSAYDSSLPPMEYNPAKAKEMLQKAGYKGEEIIFQTTQGFMLNDKPMAEAIVTMFKDVGINAKIEVFEYSVRAQTQRDKAYKGLYWTDPTDIALDPDSMMWRNIGTGAVHDYWRNPDWDKLMQDARVTMDRAKRKAIYADANKVYQEYLPWIPVIQPLESYGAQKYIDWTPRANQDFVIQDVKLK